VLERKSTADICQSPRAIREAEGELGRDGHGGRLSDAHPVTRREACFPVQTRDATKVEPGSTRNGHFKRAAGSDVKKGLKETTRTDVSRLSRETG
jgi:hypothetical protein